MLLLATLFLGAAFSGLGCEVKTRYYPRYHFAPPYGWMNDPNGFSYFKGEYHMFYQFNPNSSSEPGIAHWGHAKSPDLFNWEHLPIALYPEEWYDETGVFSGSALIEGDTMYLYYTGNVKRTSGDNPLVAEYQCLAISTDGINVEKYESNPLMDTPDHQPNIRDPKVWKHNDLYYMVLGNSFDNDTKGQVLIYKSKNKLDWEEFATIEKSDGSFGYMLECPDFFELNNKFIHLLSPQGLEAEGDKYQNLYQTGYFVGDFDYETGKYTKQRSFRELDHGHDFYATQSMIDSSGRRIYVSWMNTWEELYLDSDDGYAGQLTIPRTLTLTKDLRLLQAPVEEIKSAIGQRLYSGRGRPGKTVRLPNKAGKVELKWSSPRDIELFIENRNSSRNVRISYCREDERVVLDRGGDDGVRRTYWDPKGHFNFEIYIDASSIELFCGDGEVTFSSRFFPEREVSVRIGRHTYVDYFSVHAMRRTLPWPQQRC